VAQAHAPEPRVRAFAHEEARRPISAHDELGEEGLGAAPEPAQTQGHKRRALAFAEDNSRSTYLQAVPLPGAPEHEAPGAAEPAAFAPPVEQPEDVEPLDLDSFAEAPSAAETAPEFAAEAPEDALDAATDAPESRSDSPADAFPLQDQPMTDRSRFDDAPTPEPAADAADPLPFAAPSLRRAEPAAFDEEDAVEEIAEMTPEEYPAAPQLSVIEDFDEPEDVDEDRPLEELGLVQLAARLGASLAKRKAQIAAQPRAAAPAVVAPLAGTEDFEAAEPEEAARAIADFFGPAKASEPPVESPAEPEPARPAVPASLRALSFDSDEDFEDDAVTASFSLPLGVGAAEPEDDEDESAEADESEADDGYSSLLGMKNPFIRQQEFVRVEEPEDEDDAAEPTVTFPSAAPTQPAFAAEELPASPTARPFDPPRNRPLSGTSEGPARPAPGDPGATERDLRDALATLQRMSGAA
jgi:hypothetical protein